MNSDAYKYNKKIIYYYQMPFNMIKFINKIISLKK